MELTDLGYDSWFHETYTAKQRPDCVVARIARVDRDRYLVRSGDLEVPAELTGKLRFAAGSAEDLPCVGDWVLVQFYDGGALAIIHDLLPRKTILQRKSAGPSSEYQLIAANVDTAFIMQSCDTDFNIRRMERYLVMARDGRVEPAILLSKTDLVTDDVVRHRVSDIQRAGIDARVIPLSNVSGSGVAELQHVMTKAKTYCLLGSSGVGKTTLINRLIGREEFATSPVREKDGRGRHTTSRRQLIVLANGSLLIDTPGMRELGVVAAEASIDASFSDIHGLTSNCKFKDCSHTVEEGCALRAAVREGTVSEERYESYMKLTKESQFHAMSYLERRKKDKRFGRMVHSAMKQIKNKKK